MNKRTVSWKKWTCPLGRTDLEENQEFIDDTTYEKRDDVNEILEKMNDGLTLEDYPRAILTTCGMIPVKSYNNPTTAFNWWVLHTGFPLTKGMVERLIDWDGTEIFDQISNYRVRIAIALEFDENEFKEEINGFLSHMYDKTYGV